jgi:hypothetical protein
VNARPFVLAPAVALIAYSTAFVGHHIDIPTRDDTVASYVQVANTVAFAINAREGVSSAFPAPFVPVPADTQANADLAASSLDAVADDFRQLSTTDTGSRRQLLESYASGLAAEASSARVRASMFGSIGWGVDVWCDPAYDSIRASEVDAYNEIIDVYDLKFAFTKPIPTGGVNPATLLSCAFAMDEALGTLDPHGASAVLPPALLTKITAAVTAYSQRLSSLPTPTPGAEASLEAALARDGAAILALVQAKRQSATADTAQFGELNAATDQVAKTAHAIGADHVADM